ncbi:type VI secretion system contractile sheath small subunit [Photobacterium sanctipauli]|uniref:Type VI secretion system contractile sheath small subunit n=1 Tax=Photobacterium sanctipauli TaxID=1342794 RepID=A0A2T3NU19_9GAMM|nr:type VI secretion system contractile sheath small subunit [Photobacterium sanctipauli]PSW19770.1 type VI secretion system contractile sheath small subunit [Photobacterium sanctipauli]
MPDSGQKFIARNRAPRVQIEYDVESYGSNKKIELPFIMGVMSDLSGKGNAELPPADERKFLEIDIDNFDDRLKAFKPKVEFHVENTLTDDGGKMPVSITFESMKDFSPDAVAEKVEPIRKLLEVRKQLSNLLTYMDGKANVEQKLNEALSDPALLKSLLSMPSPDEGAAAVEDDDNGTRN